MGRPRKDAARNTRREILDRALDLFAEQGFYGTSMREIARAVGVRESALYHHFASKASILTTMVEELGPHGQAARIEELDIKAMAEALGAEAFLRQLMRVLVNDWSTARERKFLRLVMSEGPRLGKDGVINPVTYLEKARASLSRLFEMLVKKKLIRAVNPQGAALAFIGPLMMLRMRYLGIPSGQPDLKALHAEIDAHFIFFWNSIKNLTNVRPRKA